MQRKIVKKEKDVDESNKEYDKENETPLLFTLSVTFITNCTLP